MATILVYMFKKLSMDTNLLRPAYSTRRCRYQQAMAHKIMPDMDTMEIIYKIKTG